MRIPLKVLDGRIEVTVTVRAPKYRVAFSRVNAIVDTGSNETFLPEGYATDHNIPTDRLPFAKHIRLGGATFAFHRMSDVKLLFHNDAGGVETIPMHSMNLAISTKRDAESVAIAQSLPAIIGTDFLADNRLALYFCPHKDIAYLERAG